MHSVVSFIGNQNVGGEPEMDSGLAGLSFSERGSGFSLRSRAIGPSDSFGARRKVVLRGEGNA